MSVMWMPAQATMPAGDTRDSASGTSAPTGAKMIAASSGSGGASVDAPAHAHPSSRALAGPAVRPIADQPGAHQRRRVDVAVAVGNLERVARVGDDVFRIAAVVVI